MKHLLLFVCLLITVAYASAQKPIKDVKADINYNEYIAHSGFGWHFQPNTVENLTAFRNYTGEVLEVRLRIPQIGIDKVYTLQPGLEYEVFHLGYDLIPFSAGAITPLMVESTILTPGYESTVRYIWFRQGRKYN
jgi:hypothetical protein